MNIRKKFRFNLLAAVVISCLFLTTAYAQIGFNEIIVTENFPGACAAQAAEISSGGNMEIVAVSWLNQIINLYEERADGTWSEFSINIEEQGSFRYLQVCDLDRDDDADIVASGGESSGIYMWMNMDDGLFYRVPITTAYGGCHTVNRAKMTSGRAPSILATGFQDDRILLLRNDQDAVFTEYQITDTTFSFSTSILSADMNNDSIPDIVASGYTNGEIRWWENDGDLEFTEHHLGDQTRIHWITAGDYDRDGDMDVAGAAYFQGNVSIWWNDGHQVFERERIDLTFVGASFITTGDMDGDGDLDLVASDEIQNHVVWYENDGSGNFTKHMITDHLDRVMSDELVDYDNDGDLDIISTAVDAGSIVIWQNGVNEYQPTPFEMIQPAEVDTLPYDWPLYIRWEQSVDQDPEARLKYVLSFRGHYLTLDLTPVDMTFEEGDTLLQTTILDVWPDFTPFFGLDVECYVNAISQGDTVLCSRMSNLYFDPALSVEDEHTGPTEFEIQAVYPNPFNSSATLRFAVPSASVVKVDLYNLMGQKIKTLFNRRVDYGVSEINLNPGNLASGEYFIVLESDTFGKIQKKVQFIK